MKKTHRRVAALAVSTTLAVAGWSAGATGTATADSSSRDAAQSPADVLAGRGPTRIHTNGHNGEQTKYVLVKHSAQICYNIWGTNLRKGYTIAMWAYVGAPNPDQQIWSRTYYGPKNKTCSPWVHVKGFPVAAAIYSSDGAKATADVWQYWN
ncbi:hypothetical protein [Streptomyces sp. NPDC093261]|uniref:hypothetical protein n=1 Tax=Streptomyces sp. NPDC093261 TaxID=3366037 RepID=UPI00382D0CFF